MFHLIELPLVDTVVGDCLTFSSQLDVQTLIMLKPPYRPYLVTADGCVMLSFTHQYYTQIQTVADPDIKSV